MIVNPVFLTQAYWNSQDLLCDPTGVLVERGVDPDAAFLADSGDRWVGR